MSTYNLTTQLLLVCLSIYCSVSADDGMAMKKMDGVSMKEDMVMKEDGMAMKEKMRVRFCDKVSDTKILSRAVECFSEKAPEKMKTMWEFCKKEVNQSKVEEMDLVKRGCDEQQKDIFYKFVTCLETEEGKMANMRPSEEEIAQWKELGHCMENLFV